MPTVESLRPGDQVGEKHGYYLADPVFAETVRRALDLGYGVVGYEAAFDPSAHLTPKDSIAAREASQTANLVAALDRWPKGRFLVHVGYGHLAKVPDPGGNAWVAARFKAATGIDPLCISPGPPPRDLSARTPWTAACDPVRPVQILPRCADRPAVCGRKIPGQSSDGFGHVRVSS